MDSDIRRANSIGTGMALEDAEDGEDLFRLMTSARHARKAPPRNALVDVHRGQVATWLRAYGRSLCDTGLGGT